MQGGSDIAAAHTGQNVPGPVDGEPNSWVNLTHECLSVLIGVNCVIACTRSVYRSDTRYPLRCGLSLNAACGSTVMTHAAIYSLT